MKRHILCFICLLCLLLQGCGSGDRGAAVPTGGPAAVEPTPGPSPSPAEEPAPSPGPSPSPTEEPSPSPGPSQTPDEAEPLTAEPVILTRSDPGNLVEVRIEDGAAYASFNLDEWVAQRDILEKRGDPDVQNEGPFLITTTSIGVKDALILDIPELDDFILYGEAADPIIFLLMENGTVEWAVADVSCMFAAETDGLNTVGLNLCWIPEIESIFSDVDSSDGRGDLTAYGRGVDGGRYDLRLAAVYSVLPYYVWAGDLLPENPDVSGYQAFLMFSHEGDVIFRYGFIRDGKPILYTGTCSILLDADQIGHTGMITFDLYLDEEGTFPDSGAPKELHCSYFQGLQYGTEYYLYYSHGDHLCTYRGEPIKTYTLRSDNSLYANDAELYGEVFADEIKDVTFDELAGYLVSVVPAVKELCAEYGMSLHMPGEYSEIYGRQAADIWLGTDREDQFVREILYGITFSGAVFEYNPVIAEWSLAAPGYDEGSPFPVG